MKKLLIALGLVSLLGAAYAAEVKISDMVLGHGSTVGPNDVFPYVDTTGPTNTNKKIKLFDLINLAPFQSVASIDHVSTFGLAPNTAGATIVGSTFILQPANIFFPGGVSTGSQSFRGTKTFEQIIDSGLTATTVPYVDASKQLTSSAVTPTELGYVSGVTSAIQTQLNSKQATLTIGNLTDAGTDGIIVTSGSGSVIGSGTSFAQHVSDASHNGYLSSGDWSTFNGKQATVSVGALDAQAENATGLALASNVFSQQSADATHPGLVNNTTQTLGAGTKTLANIVDSGLTASTVPYADSGKQLTSSAVTPTELGYVSGVTSAIQTQLNSKQATGSYVTSLTGEATGSGPGATSVTLTNSAVIGKVLTGYTSGAGTVAATDSLLQAVQKLNGNDALKLPLLGGTMGGVIAMGDNKITGLGIPTLARDATTKDYVDAEVAQGFTNGAGLTLTGSIFSIGTGQVTSGMILDGTIVNADINAAAAIAYSKLATMTSANILVGSAGNVATVTPMSGDISISNAGSTAIQNHVVSPVMMLRYPQSTVLGNNTTGTSDGVFLTALQLANMLVLPPVALGAGTAIDWSTGDLFTKTLSANTVFTFSNVSVRSVINVILTNTASNYTVTWPSSICWTGGATTCTGTQPVQTVGAHSDTWTFINDGIKVRGNVVSNY